MERMGWLSRLAPRAGSGQRAPRRASPQGPGPADPETCLMVFRSHWEQVLPILDRRSSPPAPDDLSCVRNHSLQMLNLLAEERPRGDGSRGPILDLVCSEDVLERLLGWPSLVEFPAERRAEQLKLFEMLLSQARQPLLREQAVREPLRRLLTLCSGPTAAPAAAPAAAAPLETGLVLLLNQLCVTVAKEPRALELLFPRAPGAAPDLLVFSLLVPFVHQEGARGQRARDALLLLLAMAASDAALAQGIAERSHFCPVLATGLSALYSSLPRRLEVPGDEWHRLRREDWAGVPALARFMDSLDFCNAVIQVAHPLLRRQLVDYVHNGFLVPVMGPALHKSSLEELLASTAYLELFVRSAREPALLRTFLRFLLLHRHEGRSLLDTLVGRLGASSRLCMVSLSLFRTLLGLHCEDVMLQLVLRYLLPCSHLMLSQRRAVRDLDIYGRSAARFLALIPRCCRPQGPPGPPESDDEREGRAPAPGSPRPPSRLSLLLRPAPPPSLPPSLPSSPAPGGSPGGSPGGRGPCWAEVAELDRNYLDYLRDARCGVERCAWACRVWSAPYDGRDPVGSAIAASPPLRTKKRGLPEEAAARGEVPDLAAAKMAAKMAAAAVLRDSVLPNGAIVAPAGDVAIKKVRRSGRGDGTERERRTVAAAAAQNGAAIGWEATASPSPAASPLPPLTASPGPAMASPLPSVLPLLPSPSMAAAPPSPAAPSMASPSLTMASSPTMALPSPTMMSSPAMASPSSTVAAPPPSTASPSPPVPPSPSMASPPPPSPSMASPPPLESLLEELLARAPAEPNGAGVTIEAFTAELRQLEAAMANGARDATEAPPSDRHHEDEEEEEEDEEDEEEEDEDEAEGRARPSLPPLGIPSGRGAGLPPGQPFTGPFLAALFAKLENLPQNSLYVNFLLTGLVAQLASYPQPLLRSFLLNTNLVFQPSVKSLLQVLGSVKNKIETFAATQEDFPLLLFKAKKFLIARGKLDWAEAVPGARRGDPPGRSRKPSLGELLLLRGVGGGSQSPPIPSPHTPFHPRGDPQTPPGPPALRVRNAVYGAVVFCEFLKELAAIAQAHAVTPPLPRGPPWRMRHPPPHEPPPQKTPPPASRPLPMGQGGGG